MTFMNSPKDSKHFHLEQVSDGIYMSTEDGSIWQKRIMIDLGWGSETGYCRLPILSYEQLWMHCINFNVINKTKKVTDEEYNFYGSLSVLLNEFPDRFLRDIDALIDSGMFHQDNNQLLLEIINREYFVSDEILERISDTNMQRLCKKWKNILYKLKLFSF
jgi:hypothetical protein